MARMRPLSLFWWAHFYDLWKGCLTIDSASCPSKQKVVIDRTGSVFIHLCFGTLLVQSEYRWGRQTWNFVILFCILRHVEQWWLRAALRSQMEAAYGSVSAMHVRASMAHWVKAVFNRWSAIELGPCIQDIFLRTMFIPSLTIQASIRWCLSRWRPSLHHVQLGVILEVSIIFVYDQAWVSLTLLNHVNGATSICLGKNSSLSIDLSFILCFDTSCFYISTPLKVFLWLICLLSILSLLHVVLLLFISHGQDKHPIEYKY